MIVTVFFMNVFLSSTLIIPSNIVYITVKQNLRCDSMFSINRMIPLWLRLVIAVVIVVAIYFSYGL